MWNPIFNPSVGSSLRTYSGFINDSWRFNDRWTFNLGVRYDKTDAKDQAGKQVAERRAPGARAWRRPSTRQGTACGPSMPDSPGTRWARPATSSTSAQVPGRQSTFRYVYMGPAINQDPNAANLVSAADALKTVFNWFFANGGTSRPLRDSPTYAGINRLVGEGLITPSTWEYIGGRGAPDRAARACSASTAIFRDYRDFYAEQKDLTTGRVADPRGTLYDLGIVVNTNGVERTYKALQGQIQYRFTPDLTLGGNYTLSQSEGNFNGETDSDGPVTADALFYPEYRQQSWNYPIGDLSIDQRHKLRLWMNYGLPFGGCGARRLRGCCRT